MKSLKYVLIFVTMLAIGILAWYAGYKTSWINKKSETSVSMVMEKIQKVFKLVTVEGNISEIYDHKDYYNFDIPLFRKKALVRVNAKISAGYDFEKLNITVDEENQTITFNDFPQAEILSIEHDLDYYDITQGAFNTFTNKDYNEINKNVKEYALAKAIDSDLLKEAEEQKDEIFEMLITIIESTGWKVIVKEKENKILG